MGVTVFRFIFFFLQNFHFLVASAVLQSHMERRLLGNSDGIIYIDCGLSFTGNTIRYIPTGLLYSSDEKYISTGQNNQVSPGFNLSSYNCTLLNRLRSFPEGRRNCYNLRPLEQNNTYFIRARFLYGNYDGKHSMPTFDVYIGVNFWFTVSRPDTYIFKEIIHVATSESIDVCLVNTGRGTPFISALELRPLDNSSYPASPAFSLVTWVHDDYGGLDSTSSSREVWHDAYDRLWHRNTTWPGCKVINTTNESFNASQANISCKVPTSVLMTACEQKDGLPNMTWKYTMTDPTAQLYVYWHFAELELLGSDDTREFNLFVTTNGPGYKFGPIRPNYLQVTTVASPIISLNGSGFLYYTFEKTNESNHYPILNAMEVYSVLDLPVSPTNQEDVDAVTAIKNNYGIPKIWQGDPCLPINYQWEGLNCTNIYNNPPRVTSLNLSSSNLTGDLPPSLSNLTSLTYLDLSNNGLTGKIPEFLANLPALKVIDLTGNNLVGPVPHLLAKKAHKKSVVLRLQGNPDVCKSYPCSGKNHHFIIPMVTTVVSVPLLVIIGIIFLVFKWRKKPETGVHRTVKVKNKQFNSSDIIRITDSFKKVLGRGGFGTVYYGVLQDGTKVAVKLLSNTSSTVNVKQFCVEAELLLRIHHVNLVSLVGYCDEHANMALVYEYMSSGDLQMHLSERNEHPLSWKRRLHISVDAAQGLEYLHSGCQPPVVHRDVKPANILLDEMGHAKIADFGLCRYCPTDIQGAAMTNIAGTRGYLDPEYCQLHTLSEKSDVYGFGIVLLQLLTGQPTFIKSSDNHEDDLPTHILKWVSSAVESGDILTIVDKRLQGDSNVSSAMKFFEIAMECVKPTGKERPRMSEVVADLKLCYASEGFHDQIDLPSVDSGNYNLHSSQLIIDCSLSSLLPR